MKVHYTKAVPYFATGAICYEAMQPEQNAKIQQRIYELKALGTMYYSSKTIQNYLRDIHFEIFLNGFDRLLTTVMPIERNVL